MVIFLRVYILEMVLGIELETLFARVTQSCQVSKAWTDQDFVSVSTYVGIFNGHILKKMIDRRFR